MPTNTNAIDPVHIPTLYLRSNDLSIGAGRGGAASRVPSPRTHDRSTDDDADDAAAAAHAMHTLTGAPTPNPQNKTKQGKNGPLLPAAAGLLRPAAAAAGGGLWATAAVWAAAAGGLWAGGWVGEFLLFFVGWID